MPMRTLIVPWDTFETEIDRRLASTLPSDEWLIEERSDFLPPIDVFHDDEKVTIRVEIPGCKREDLDVRVEGEVLTISGKKEHLPSRNYHQVESRCGRFARSIELGHGVEVEKLSALYKDGILTVTLPLLPTEKPKQIDIKSD
jgi:HSP20 family protein